MYFSLKFLEKNKETFEIVRRYINFLNQNILILNTEEKKISFIEILITFLKNQNYEKYLGKILLENVKFFDQIEIQKLLEEFLNVITNGIKNNHNLIE